MAESIRSFIAVELPAPAEASIGRLQEQLRGRLPELRWVRPGNIHLTLRFLGEVAPAAVSDIHRVLQEAARPAVPMTLRGQGIGVFPGIRKARVLWVGVQGDLAPLARLQERIEKGLEELGWPREGRPFRAHLTLGRFKGPADGSRLQRVLMEFENYAFDPFSVTQIVLFRSDLKSGGAVYTKLEQVRLGPVL
jgi:2'-5' RNA ligase